MRRAIIFLLLVICMARVEVSIAAEREIKKFPDNNYLWFKNICNVDLRPNQLIWLDQMDRFTHTSVVSAPRVGKTYGVEMHGLKMCAKNPYEDYRIWAPAEHQAKRALKYQLDAIMDSPVLSAYIETRLGRKQIRTTGYTFQNHSNTEYFGQNANLDSVNATILRGEEFDDMDMDIWRNRILPRGMAKNKNGLPTRIRITGVIQGKENLYALETDATFESLTKIDIYDGLALDLIDKDYFKLLQTNLTADQWLRIALVKFVESRNFFWSIYLRKMQKAGAKMLLTPIVPEAGGRYETTGTVAFGLDMGAQGESKTSSKYSLQVVERIGHYKRWLYAHEWEPTVNPKILRRDVVRLWDFFRPAGGYGDAFDANIIAAINDDLYSEGIISYNRQREHAENTSGNWQHWTLKPIRFQGAAKHLMFKGMQNDIHQGLFFTPLVISGDERYDLLAKTIRQLENIRSKKGGAAYLLYEMIKKLIGDDDVDALGMSCAYLDEGYKPPVVIEGHGSGQKMAGFMPPSGVFNT